jgi:hypothetical protein
MKRWMFFLMDEDFSCNLDVLNGGIGITFFAVLGILDYYPGSTSKILSILTPKMV